MKPFVSILSPVHNMREWISDTLPWTLVRTWRLSHSIILADGRSYSLSMSESSKL
jgi:hypothetical protein